MGGRPAGKHAFVTGAGQGIGRAIAIRFVREGATSRTAAFRAIRAVARDVISSGMRCNALSPGTTHSPSLQDRIDASDETAYMTGQLPVIDGGQTL